MAAVVFAAPGVLVLASFVGLVHFDMNMLFVALPALAAAVALAVVARGALGNLLLPRPVLHADSEGLIDRRIMAVPVPWSNVLRAVSIPGGLVLELREPISTLGMGSFVYEQPEPGIAFVGLWGLTVPPWTLAHALLELASAAGSETGEADGHEKLPRRRWSV